MVINKKQIGRFLQKSNLIQLVDTTKLLVSILRNRNKNRQFLNEHPGFVPPPYFLSYDAYNHTNWTQYYHLGLSIHPETYLQEKDQGMRMGMRAGKSNPPYGRDRRF